MKAKSSLLSMLAILLIIWKVQAQYANTSLSNLTSPTAVNQSLIPQTTGIFDLGSKAKYWRSAYFNRDISIHGLTVGTGTGAVSSNTALGNGALHSNIDGYKNTGNGYQALYSNTIGIYNTANGYQALFYNTMGGYNTANGEEALYSNINGSDNTANGHDALFYNTLGYGNTANGLQALFYNTIGDYNAANGYIALFNNTTGSYNTANGYFALISNTTGNYNTTEGSFADVNSGGYSNSSGFGNSALITASNQVRIGNSTVTSIGGYVDWSNISDGRVKENIRQNVPGLAFINKLQPITYNLDLYAADKIVQRPEITDNTGKVVQPSQDEISSRKTKEQIVYTGFVAQDVEKAAQEVGYDFSGVDAPKNDKDLYALRYADFVVPLVKAVQELSQQNNDLKKEVDDLKAAIENPKSAMNGSDAKLPSSNLEFQTASLDQNSPNPFSQNTVISYFIPQTANNAVIKIYSLQGEEVKSFNVNDKGNGQITVAGSTMQAGLYAYVLIVDGTIIDSRQMILTK